MSQSKNAMIPAVATKSVPAAGDAKSEQSPKPQEHPADHPHGPTHWWVWVLILAIAVAAVFGIYKLVKLNTSRAESEAAMKKAKHATPVVVAKAQEGDLQIYLTGLGTVTPLATVNLHTRVDGQIVKVNFKEGQLVKTGDVLFEIDPDPYNAALHQANGQLAKDTAMEVNAMAVMKMDSAANTGSPGSVAEQQVLADKATEAEAAAAMEADRASIEAAQVNVNYCTIKSPVDGRIGLRKVDEGNIVHAADTTALAVITQLSPITVVFTLPEDDINRIEKQIAISEQTHKPVQVLAFDRNLTKQLATGNLLALDSQIDPTSGTLAIKAAFANAKTELFPNQFVNARLQVEKLKDVLMVPSAAIQPGNGTSGPYVYIVKDLKTVKDTNGGGEHTEGTVHMQPVKTGASQPAIRAGEEDRTVITSGVTNGDTVVIDGVDKLVDGSPVSVPSPRSTTQPAGGGRHGAGGASPDPSPADDQTPTTGPAADLEPTTVPMDSMSAPTTGPTAGMHPTTEPTMENAVPAHAGGRGKKKPN